MKTADLIDKFASELTLCHLPFLKFGKRKAFWGPIQTVKCYEDNLLLKAELQKPGKHRVLVVDAGGSTRIAVLGDIIAGILHDNAWAGILINGAIRDSAEIDTMDVGVFCLATSPVKSRKEGKGEVGVQVEFGGVRFVPGGYLYCDADGALYCPRNLVSD